MIQHQVKEFRTTEKCHGVYAVCDDYTEGIGGRKGRAIGGSYVKKKEKGHR